MYRITYAESFRSTVGIHPNMVRMMHKMIVATMHLWIPNQYLLFLRLMVRLKDLPNITALRQSTDFDIALYWANFSTVM